MGGGPGRVNGAAIPANPPPNHPLMGYPKTCADCHTTATWLGAIGHPELLFPIAAGVHANIACRSCHDVSISSNFKVNANCTATCHSAANTEGFNSTNSAVPEVSGHHNGATFDNTNPMFCRSCHPDGQLASNILNPDGSLASLGTSSHTFNLDHQGAGGTCSNCHTPAYSPPDPLNQPDFSQDLDCTAVNGCHHHPNRNGFQGN